MVKRIVDLENQNAELRVSKEDLEDRVKDKEAMVKRIVDLENQNAELGVSKEDFKATADKFQKEIEKSKSEYQSHLREKDNMNQSLEAKVKELEQQNSLVQCDKENMFQEKDNKIMELTESLQNRINSHEQEIQELKESNAQNIKKIDAKNAEQKAQMKEKFQSKLKEAGGIMQTKYNEKLEQYASEKDKEVSEIRASEAKFSKMAEELQKKYNASKAIVTEKVVENKKLKAEVEELRKMLGSKQEQQKKQTSKSPPQPAKDVFKAPKLAPKNTPGRSKPGRTQSDVQIKAPSRRPPLGTGTLFTMDDEQGEMFSNSYLSELKSGKSSMDHSGTNLILVYFEQRGYFINGFYLKVAFPSWLAATQ